MSIADLKILLPIIILGISPVILMTVIAFYRSHTLTFISTIVTLALSSIALFRPISLETHTGIFIVMDKFAVFYMALLFGTALVTSILAFNYLRTWQCIREEFYLLLLIATLGCAVLVCSNHFATFFLGLEILSVSLYILIAYPRSTLNQVEAGMKYLILAGSSSAFLLFGMALIYFHLGTMEISNIISLVSKSGIQNSVMLAGFGMLIVGIGFKLAIVPFHLWTPDVYQGAPAPVTGFIATASKGAVFAILLRLFSMLDIHNSKFYIVFACIAIASMFVGNTLALLQNNIKRILAYSSIAHLGYLLVALLAGGTLAITAGTFYLLAYFITTLGAFAVIAILSANESEPDTLEAYKGLGWQHPILGAVFTAMLLSLAGIPVTAGFIGKFYVLWAGVNSYLWLLVIILVINSAIGLFYYLRVIVALYSAPGEHTWSRAEPISLVSGCVLAVLSLLLVWIGVYPTSFVEIIQNLRLY